MANLSALASNAQDIIYLSASGTGAIDDPFVSHFTVEGIDLVATEDTLQAVKIKLDTLPVVANRVSVTTELDQPLTDTQLRLAPIEVVVAAGTDSIGSISNTTFNAIQSGSWDVSVNNLPTTFEITDPIPVTGSVEISNDIDSPITISGNVTANTGLTQPLTDTQLRASSVNTNITNASIAVTGEFYPVTQPVSLTSLPSLATGSNVIGSISNTSFAVSNFPATQAVTVSTLPLPTGAASEITLQQVRDVIKSQIDIASTIWTDSSGAFYVRRDLVNEDTGTITVIFTDPEGVTAAPGAGLKPLASVDKDVLSDYYDVLVSGTGYSVGDLLVRVGILDVNSSTPSSTFIWLNLTAGTILSGSPDSNGIERANEVVGSKQSGSWDVGITGTLPAFANTPTVNLGTISGASTSAKQDTTNITLSTIENKIPSSLTVRATRLLVDGSDVTQPVSGTVTADTGLVQPLTNIELRASPVVISAATLPLPNVTSGIILSVTTNATGTTYTAFGSQVCTALDLINNTGTTIEYRRGATGNALQIPDKSARLILGITNANQIDVRRTDTSNTPVNIQAEAFVS